MVATPEALKEVVLSERGLVRTLGPGQVYIDMSTVGPHTVRSIAARFAEGIAVVDAPSGQRQPGRRGPPRDLRRRQRPRLRARAAILEALGSVLHVGALGAGAAIKLVANLALGASIAAVARR